MSTSGRHTVAEEDRYRDELKARSHAAREEYYGSSNSAQASLAREDQLLAALAAEAFDWKSCRDGAYDPRCDCSLSGSNVLMFAT